MAEGDVAADVTVDLTEGSSDSTTTKMLRRHMNVVKSRETAGKGNLSLDPVLVIEASKAYEAIYFYKIAFGAKEIHRNFHLT
ncbi:hypothetical protein MKX03_024384, partial [Papaver bracteatum]